MRVCHTVGLRLRGLCVIGCDTMNDMAENGLPLVIQSEKWIQHSKGNHECSFDCKPK